MDQAEPGWNRSSSSAKKKNKGDPVKYIMANKGNEKIEEGRYVSRSVGKKGKTRSIRPPRCGSPADQKKKKKVSKYHQTLKRHFGS
jgi:hypothetical protein